MFRLNSEFFFQSLFSVCMKTNMVLELEISDGFTYSTFAGGCSTIASWIKKHLKFLQLLFHILPQPIFFTWFYEKHNDHNFLPWTKGWIDFFYKNCWTCYKIFLFSPLWGDSNFFVDILIRRRQRCRKYNEAYLANGQQDQFLPWLQLLLYSAILTSVIGYVPP